MRDHDHDHDDEYDGGGGATGDPQLDRGVGYQSPRRTGNLTGYHPSGDHRAADALAQSKRDREQRRQKRRER
jgi:hypothetical protein